jgi:hypothetical protein
LGRDENTEQVGEREERERLNRRRGRGDQMGGGWWRKNKSE